MCSDCLIRRELEHGWAVSLNRVRIVSQTIPIITLQHQKAGAADGAECDPLLAATSAGEGRVSGGCGVAVAASRWRA